MVVEHSLSGSFAHSNRSDLHLPIYPQGSIGAHLKLLLRSAERDVRTADSELRYDAIARRETITQLLPKLTEAATDAPLKEGGKNYLSVWLQRVEEAPRVLISVQRDEAIERLAVCFNAIPPNREPVHPARPGRTHRDPKANEHKRLL